MSKSFWEHIPGYETDFVEEVKEYPLSCRVNPLKHLEIRCNYGHRYAAYTFSFQTPKGGFNKSVMNSRDQREHLSIA